MSIPRLPNFVGIGAQRAATTWIYQCLRQHPEVYVPEVKEVNFFSWHFEKGIAWYESHFQAKPRHKAMGEISPIYLSHESAFERMAKTIPDARLFVILREPVSRAYSAYELHREKFQGGFRRACEQRPDYLVNLGLYARHLKRVYTYYDRAQVRVFLYEELQSDPNLFLADLFGFLDINEHFRPENIKKRYNRIMYRRTQRILCGLGMNGVIDTIKETQIGEWIRNRHVRRHPNHLTTIQTEDLIWLKDQFQEDILELQQLINRDLSSWL